jgi:hypothetical protein
MKYLILNDHLALCKTRKHVSLDDLTNELKVVSYGHMT